MDAVTLRSGAGADRRAVLRTAARMLRLAKAGESLGRRRNPFPPLLHLLANMFLCSFAQRYLADDAGGVYLPLFLVAQYALALLITMSFVGRTGAVIINKTRLYPGSSAAGYYFLLAGSLRRPEFCLFAGVGCVYPAIAFSPGLIPSTGIVASTILPLIASQALCCAAAAGLIRSSRPLTGLVLVSLVATAAVLVSVFLFRTNALASNIPMVGWAAAGIRAFSTGEMLTGWKYLAYLTLVTGAILALFRK